LDLSGFALNVQDEPAPEEDVQPEPEDVDAAIGDVYSPFGAPPENDGPSDDVVTESPWKVNVG
jgi:hypothetical protein